jgi:hypothetical protein
MITLVGIFSFWDETQFFRDDWVYFWLKENKWKVVKKRCAVFLYGLTISLSSFVFFLEAFQFFNLSKIFHDLLLLLLQLWKITSYYSFSSYCWKKLTHLSPKVITQTFKFLFYIKPLCLVLLLFFHVSNVCKSMQCTWKI